MLLQSALEVAVKGVAGGLLVVLFALVAETLAPKRFAGVFAAAPSVALASLAVTVLMKDAAHARSSCAGMVAGAIGFVVYGLIAPPLMRRWGSIAGAGAALVGWFAGAGLVLSVVAATAGPHLAVAAAGRERQQERDRPALEFKPEKIREAKPKDWWIRFAFGAGTSVVAGVLSATAGSLPGGSLLAFPAILLASLTLVKQNEGAARARDDARGATFGALGLLAFAAVGSAAFGPLPPLVVFLLATLAWAAAALGAYGIAWLAGAGGDEPKEA